VNDVEGQLRELLETKSRDGAIDSRPAPKLLKRARRRQLATALTAVVGVVALVTASTLAMQALVGTDPVRPRPAEEPVVPQRPDGFRSVAMPFASIAYPDGWFLMARSRPPGDLLQLTNFDPQMTWPCFSGDALELPRNGVLLLVAGGPGAIGPDAPRWPVDLAYDPAPSACRPGGLKDVLDPGEPAHLDAQWTSADGEMTFDAQAMVGSDATTVDREKLFEAFSTLYVVDAVDPQMEVLLGDSNLILDATTTPIGPTTLYAYADDFEAGATWIGISGPAGSGLSGGVSVGDHAPAQDEGVTMNLGAWGGVVWGTVAANVQRAELRTVEGETFPATLLPMPASLGVTDQQVVWGVLDVETTDRVTTLVFDEQGSVLNTHYPTGPRVVIGTGADPEGGRWQLYLDRTDQGTGLGFAFEVGGGGGGCCLRPLKGDFRLDGYGSGSDEPSNITALGSNALERVVFEAASGEVIEGEVFEVPDETLGVPKVALVIVPEGVRLEGNLFAFDDEANELGHEFVGDLGEPVGPTADIDAVWTLLRDGRDAISRWAGRHGDSLADLDVDEARVSMPDIPWNESGPGKPVPYEVSLRGVARAGGSELSGWSGWTVVLVSATRGPEGTIGNTYCVAVNIDENGGGNYRYGVQDAAGYEECRGGWPELSG
jgi:hypothetical protein